MAYTGNPYEVIPRLESLGETKVRELLPTGEFGEPESILRFVVEVWLASKESLRRAASETAMLAVAKEANSIARKARSEARRANIIAIIAMILSTTIAISMIIIEFSKP